MTTVIQVFYGSLLFSTMNLIPSLSDSPTLNNVTAAATPYPISNLVHEKSNRNISTSESIPAILVHVQEVHSVSNLRHHHHSHPWGPHFEDNPSNYTVQEGFVAILDCKVGLIEDKLVSWLRRKSDQLDLLTLGTTNHSSDSRISSDFKYPNNWRLSIRNSSRNDSGTYLCQINSIQPKILQVQLLVEAPEVFIVNSRGERIREVIYEEGSTLQLICSVDNVKSKFVNWFRNKDFLNHDVVRGGVSIKTDMTTENAKSVLQVAWVTKKDEGTYLCSSPPFNATARVHILNGENPAELYRNQGMIYKLTLSSSCLILLFLVNIYSPIL